MFSHGGCVTFDVIHVLTCSQKTRLKCVIFRQRVKEAIDKKINKWHPNETIYDKKEMAMENLMEECKPVVFEKYESENLRNEDNICIFLTDSISYQFLFFAKELKFSVWWNAWHLISNSPAVEQLVWKKNEIHYQDTISSPTTYSIFRVCGLLEFHFKKKIVDFLIVNATTENELSIENFTEIIKCLITEKHNFKREVCQIYRALQEFLDYQDSAARNRIGKFWAKRLSTLKKFPI